MNTNYPLHKQIAKLHSTFWKIYNISLISKNLKYEQKKTTGENFASRKHYLFKKSNLPLIMMNDPIPCIFSTCSVKYCCFSSVMQSF